MVFNINIVDLTTAITYEINNILYKIFFIVPLNYLHSITYEIHPTRTTVSWFPERATTSSKISSGIKLGLQSNSANDTSSCDLILI